MKLKGKPMKNEPAFPVLKSNGYHDAGMTLRDYAALQALPACLMFDYGNDWGKAGKDHAPRSVRKAFEIADAFMVEREKSR